MKNSPKVTIDFPELERRARDILTAAGLVVDSALDWSGKLTYAGTQNKPDSKNGRYVLHADFPPSVTWINYAMDGGEKHTERLCDDAVKLTRRQRAELAETIRQTQVKREKEQTERRRKAAERAKAIYDTAPAAGDDNAYLAHKGIPSVEGLRHDKRGNLLVPVMGRGGELMTLQTIGADGTKTFLKDGAIEGGYFPILSQDDDKTGALLICEGVATGISVYLATGCTVLCAFSCGNMDAVARYARELHPQREIVLCADNDALDKEGRPRKVNPGVKAAQAAGAAIGAAVAVCPLVDGQNADFNDLHRTQGVDTVKSVLEQARGIVPLPEGYVYDEKHGGALTYLKPTGDDDFTPVRVCGHVEFTGRTHGERWGYLLSFVDGLNRKRNIAIPARLFQLPGSEWAAILADAGLDIEPRQQRLFASCVLAMRDRLPLVMNVERCGWVASSADEVPSYVLPDKVFSASKKSIVFQSGTSALPGLYTQAGTLDGWKQMAELCAGNTRFVFALSVAFAGPLLYFFGVDGGVLHFEGGSSAGKTTGLRLAASVWGSPDAHMRTWRTTDCGLEAVLPLFNDNTLAMDELGMVGARALAESSYMISSGAGKTRANRSGGARAISTWRVVILSSGEVGLTAKLYEDGLEARAGQNVRFVGVPMTKEHLADLHGMNAGDLIAKLNALCRVHYGVAGRAFLDALMQEAMLRDFVNGAQRLLDDTVAQWTPEGADAQVIRVARRFALCFVAGQYAQWFGVLPSSMDIAGAVKSCFDDWLQERGSAGEQEREAILAQVKTFLQKHGQSRFQDVSYPEGTVINRAGFREHDDDDDGTTFFVFPGPFKQEVIRGFSARQAIVALRRAGWLVEPSDKGGQKIKRLPNMGPTRVYAIRLTAEPES